MERISCNFLYNITEKVYSSTHNILFDEISGFYLGVTCA